MTYLLTCVGCPDIGFCSSIQMCCGKEHPIVILADMARYAHPGRELDIPSFMEAKLALDATMDGLDPVVDLERSHAKGKD